MAKSVAKDLQDVSEKAGARLQWNDATSSPESERQVREMLAKPLTSESAVQIAVLNSPQIQAMLKNLGIARADLRQARILANPSLEATFMGAGRSDGHQEYVFKEDVYAFLLYPLRRQLASAQFDQAKMRLADQLLEQLTEVKTVVLELQGLEQTRTLFQGVLEASQTSMELVERQRKAGNINALEYSLQHSLFQESQLALIQLNSEIPVQEQRLNQLLGLGTTHRQWQVDASLPELPGNDPGVDTLLSVAGSKRMDLAAARLQTSIIKKDLLLTRLGFIPSLEAGIGFEREEGVNRSGPVVQVSIPIFDRRQATVARLKAQRLQNADELRSLELKVQSEVQTQLKRMAAARELAEYYRSTIIPLRENVIEEYQKHYNFMLAGVYQLLQAKQSELAAKREYVNAVRSYWTARAELERSVGGALPEPTSSKPGTNSSSGISSSDAQSGATATQNHQHGDTQP